MVATYFSLQTNLIAETDLPVIIIEGKNYEQTTAGPVDRNRAFTANSGTRTQTPIKEIPQSIIVIPKKVIEDQQSETITDVIRNVSGVQGKQTREGTQQIDGDYLIRGQFTEAYVNGRNTFLDQGLDPQSLINVERIEVLKGPTSSLFTAANGAPISGVVNLVEKLPEREAFYEFEGNLGSFDFLDGAFDINQPITENGNYAIRVTGHARDNEDYVDDIESDSKSIYPTFRFDNDTTAVTLRGRYQEYDYDFYNGLPVDGDNVPAPGVSRKDAPFAFDQPETDNTAKGVDAVFEHKITKNLTFRSRAGIQEAEGTQFTSSTTFFAGTFSRSDFRQDLEVESTDYGAEFIYEHELSDWEHTFLLGAEHQRTTEEGGSNFNFGVDAGATIESIQDAPFTVLPNNNLLDAEYETDSLILQSQSTFFDRAHLLLGMTATDVDISYETSFNGIPGTTPDVDDTLYNQRLGLAFDLTDQITPFIGFGRGFRVPRGLSALPGGPVKIERNKQLEAGVRFENNTWGLSGSAAVYRLEREDAAVFVGFSRDIADQESKGFDVDLIWQPTKAFSMLANYAYTDAEISDSDSPFEDNRLQRVPKHSGRIALRYEFISGSFDGLGLGFGVTSVSRQAGDLANTFFTDGYKVFDFQASYKRKNIETSIGIENLFDHDEFIPNFFFNGNSAPLTPFTAVAKLKVKFGN